MRQSRLGVIVASLVLVLHSGVAEAEKPAEEQWRGAFAKETGKDHWEPLLRARAIENQCFVLAPAQWGAHSPDRASHGRSMLVDPWGLVLALAPDRPGVVVAECDLEAQDRIRSGLPALSHRRL